jgi:hypothetical protein
MINLQGKKYIKANGIDGCVRLNAKEHDACAVAGMGVRKSAQGKWREREEQRRKEITFGPRARIRSFWTSVLHGGRSSN